MRHSRGFVVFAAAAALLFATPRGSRADEPAEPPATVPVEKGPFTVVVEMDGTFDAKGAVEVAYKPEGHEGDLELEVVEAAPFGPVEAGQVLVRFKADKMEEERLEAEAELKLAEANLAHQEAEAKRQQETTEVAVKKAEHEKATAEEALKTFVEVRLPLQVKESEHDIQQEKDSIQDQGEELAQLEKMYKADEVVEETEEIVLKRTRRSLERSKESLEFATKRHDLLVNVDLPRELESLTLEKRSSDHGWDVAQATAKSAVEQSTWELEKSRRALDRQQKAYARLTKDCEGLVLKAPAAGTSVPGSLEHGKWSRSDEMRKALRPGGKVKAHETVLTIVNHGATDVRALLPEARLFDVREGMKAYVIPTAAVAAPIGAEVAYRSLIGDDAMFEVRLNLASSDQWWMPGLTCKVKVSGTPKADALTVPAKSVGMDGDASYVEVPDGKKSKRVTVKVGATSGGRTEILEGLKAGDKVLEKPAKDE